MTQVNVAFCIDSGALTGLHIALASLLNHLSSKIELQIFVLHEGLAGKELELVAQTIRISNKNVSLQPIEITSRRFVHLDSFVGGQMTYARLFLPEFLSVGRVIYLDADLIVEVDIAELWQQKLHDKCIGAVSWQIRKTAHDSQLFIHLGEDIEKPYFNAGVLLMNLDGMRTSNVTSQLIEAAKKLKGKLISHDQSLINLYLFDTIHALPRRFNTVITPRRKEISPSIAKNRILHLVARPKPWDPLGKLNGQYRHFIKYHELSALAAKQNTQVLNFRNVVKVLRSGRAYLKCLVRKAAVF